MLSNPVSRKLADYVKTQLLEIKNEQVKDDKIIRCMSLLQRLVLDDDPEINHIVSIVSNELLDDCYGDRDIDVEEYFKMLFPNINFDNVGKQSLDKFKKRSRVHILQNKSQNKSQSDTTTVQQSNVTTVPQSNVTMLLQNNSGMLPYHKVPKLPTFPNYRTKFMVNNANKQKQSFIPLSNNSTEAPPNILQTSNNAGGTYVFSNISQKQPCSPLPNISVGMLVSPNILQTQLSNLKPVNKKEIKIINNFFENKNMGEIKYVKLDPIPEIDIVPVNIAPINNIPIIFQNNDQNIFTKICCGPTLMESILIDLSIKYSLNEEAKNAIPVIIDANKTLEQLRTDPYFKAGPILKMIGPHLYDVYEKVITTTISEGRIYNSSYTTIEIKHIGKYGTLFI